MEDYVLGHIRPRLHDVAACFFTKQRTEWDVIEVSECDFLTPEKKGFVLERS